MKNFKWDKKYLYWGVTVFCVVAASLVLFWVVTRWSAVLGIVKYLAGILSSILIGLCVAYVLSPALNFLEKKFFLRAGRRVFPKNAARAASAARYLGIFTVIILMLAVITGLLIIALPQVYISMKKLVVNMESYYDTAIKWLEGLFNSNTEAESTLAGLLRGAVDYFTNWVQTSLLPQLEHVIASFSSGVISVVMAIFNFIVGIIVSVYVLYRKEEFASHAKMLLYSMFSRGASKRILGVFTHLHGTFGKYLTGSLLDSLIVGIVCYIFMQIFRMPYPELISVIVGVTNIIPFFGPYIGAIPSGFLILLENPLQCLIFAVFILALQIFDGNFLCPRILGSSTGLSGFWIIFSIMLFGGFFGLPGMLFGVPLFAVIYTGISSWCARRLQKKGLPCDTASYGPGGPPDGGEAAPDDESEIN